MHVDAVSLRQLRFFVTLARTGNFSRAAEQVAVTQPALSAAIRQIEQQIGARLFERTTHRVALTDAGAALLPHAQRLLATADNAFADMRDVATRERATIRIGAMPSAIPAVATAVASLTAANPAVALHLGDGNSDVLIADLRKGGFDMIVCVVSRQEVDLESTILHEDEMVVVLRRDHKLADQAKLPWSALRGEEIVHFRGGSIGELCSAALRQNSLAASLRYKVDQVDSLYGLVRSGLAVGIMPRLYTRGFGDEIVLIPLARAAVKRCVVLLNRPQLRDEYPVAARFRTSLAAALRGGLLAGARAKPSPRQIR